MGWELIRDERFLFQQLWYFWKFGCANDSQAQELFIVQLLLLVPTIILILMSLLEIYHLISLQIIILISIYCYSKCIGWSYSASQNITVDITRDSNLAQQSAQSYTLNLLPKDQNALNFSLSGSDSNGDSLTYSLVTNPTYGSVTLSGSSVTYTTNSGHVSAQTDSFTFKANDGTSDSNIGTISIDLKTDPLYKYQWHLDNTEQSNFASTTGTLGDDLNVDSVINSGYTGSGVIINVVDEGLELAHEDLADNIVPGSYDLVDNDTDPTNSGRPVDHGTSVAGISVCGLE